MVTKTRRRTSIIPLIAVISLVLLASCGGMGRGMHGTNDVTGSLDEMPVAEFYRANCASCHGKQRQGGVGPALLPSRLIESDDYYFDTIALGRSGTAMPSWSALGLSDNDITELVAFLRAEP